MKFVVPIIFLILIVGSLRYSSGEPTEKLETKLPLSVSTATVERKEKSDELWFAGTVEGLTSAIISSRYSDQISDVYVENGQTVRCGDVLFTIDSKELENNVRLAENELRKAQVNHENITVNHSRQEQLFEIGAVSRETLDTAVVQWKTSRADLDDAQTKLQIAQKRLTDATVTSPVDGVAANKKLTRGQMVAAGEQLMTVEEIDAVYVTIQVEQQFISKIQIGTVASVKVDAFPDRTFEGRAAVLNPVAGRDNRLFEVKIRAENTEFLLMPGMFAEVLIDGGEKISALTVPRAAVISVKGQNYIYTLKGNRAQRRRIEVGELFDDDIEILSGANAGEVVIVDNVDKLKDGDEVLIRGGDFA